MDRNDHQQQPQRKQQGGLITWELGSKGQTTDLDCSIVMEIMTRKRSEKPTQVGRYIHWS